MTGFLIDIGKRMVTGPLGRIEYVVALFLLNRASPALPVGSREWRDIRAALMIECVLYFGTTVVTAARLLDIGLSRWWVAILWVPVIAIASTWHASRGYDSMNGLFIASAVPALILGLLAVFCPSGLLRKPQKREPGTMEPGTASANPVL
jgi:uncharacterized membrane protein YhaH (DUF805 family)